MNKSIDEILAQVLAALDEIAAHPEFQDIQNVIVIRQLQSDTAEQLLGDCTTTIQQLQQLHSCYQEAMDNV